MEGPRHLHLHQEWQETLEEQSCKILKIPAETYHPTITSERKSKDITRHHFAKSTASLFFVYGEKLREKFCDFSSRRQVIQAGLGDAALLSVTSSWDIKKS